MGSTASAERVDTVSSWRPGNHAQAVRLDGRAEGHDDGVGGAPSQTEIGASDLLGTVWSTRMGREPQAWLGHHQQLRLDHQRTRHCSPPLAMYEAALARQPADPRLEPLESLPQNGSGHRFACGCEERRDFVPGKLLIEPKHEQVLLCG